MKVVVFGGSGFLGSHVADVLSEKGYEVVIFDLKPSPYLKEPQEIVMGDILDFEAVKEVTKGADVVYNFAGIADIDEAKLNPIETVKTNILGNTNVIEAAAKAEVKRFVFASSIYVYSQSGSFYRSSKQACELIVENYQKIYNLPFTVLRYGSLYGTRTDENNWIYHILKQAVKQGKIIRYGNGEEIREYIHIKDAARCSAEILGEEYKNQYVIISGHQQMKVKDLLVMIKEILEKKPEIEFRPINDERCSYDSETHYEMTPYVFKPKLAMKMVSRHYVDLGQGILEVLDNIYRDELLYKQKKLSSRMKQ